MSTSVPRTLPDIVADLYARIAELERRLQNQRRTGTVHQVDAARGLARVKLDEDEQGNPYLTGWIPWKEISMGAIRTHFPPSAGEQVEVVSESGDITDAVIDTSTPSNANPRPHDQEAEPVITVGDTRIHITGGLVHVKSPTIKLEAPTKIEMKSPLIKIEGDIDHVGANTQTGIHTDSNGLHS